MMQEDQEESLLDARNKDEVVVTVRNPRTERWNENERSEFEASAELPMAPRGFNAGSSKPLSRVDSQVVRKSFLSRITYGLILLSIVLMYPLWLRFIVIKNIDHTHHKHIWDSRVKLEVTADLNLQSNDMSHCGICADLQDITYRVDAKINDFRPHDKVQSASYVVLLASFDFDKWFLVSKPGMLTHLSAKTNSTQERRLCHSDPAFDSDSSLQSPTRAPTTTPPIRKVASLAKSHNSTSTDDDDTSNLPSFLGDDDATIAALAEAELSTCCLGKPGSTWLVGCIMDSWPDVGDSYYVSWDKPPFNDRCIAIDGVCGNSCGAAAYSDLEHCDSSGKIPLEDLITLNSASTTNDNDDDDDNNNSHRRRASAENDDDNWKDRQPANFKALYHYGFITLLTMSAVGLWISYSPGVGVDTSPPCPSMLEVEEHFCHHRETQAPLCLVAFSVSASEPRMMVLRNMCGKLVAWVRHRKFVFEPESQKAKDRVKKMQRRGSSLSQNLSTSGSTVSINNEARIGGVRTHFDDEQEDIEDQEEEYAQQASRAPSRADSEQSSIIRPSIGTRIDDLVELVDMLADEGHRVGCYALWDSFLDVVDGCDLRFVENLASKMRNMVATSSRLVGKNAEDDADVLLDAELRELASRPDMGVDKIALDRLEIAWACYDLLSALGHPLFWREDASKSMLAANFRDLASSPEHRATLMHWSKTYRERIKDNKETSRIVEPFDDDVAPLASDRKWLQVPAEDKAAQEESQQQADDIEMVTRRNRSAAALLADNSLGDEIWLDWYAFYREQGRSKWTKCYDFTRWRAVRLTYYSANDVQTSGNRSENATNISDAGAKEDLVKARTVVACYAARANPEDRPKHVSVPGATAKVRNVRGVKAGTYICLADAYACTEMQKHDADWRSMRGRAVCSQLSREAARRSFARVVRVRTDPHTSTEVVDISEASPEMLLVLEKADRERPERQFNDTSLERSGRSSQSSTGALYSSQKFMVAGDIGGLGESNDDIEWRERWSSKIGILPKRKQFFEAVHEATLPLSSVQPLRQCRGKSGGMNHAIELLDEFLRSSHSRTMARWQNFFGLDMNHQARFCFAIFDCRHMATHGFWDAVMPHFFEYRNPCNPWDRALTINNDVAFVQIPQTFTGLTLEDDFFDMRNEYLFRIANTLRSGVGAITSCGTNAVWSWPLAQDSTKCYTEELPSCATRLIKMRFNELTMIEDTATSHDEIIHGRKGVYHFERLVLGARKGTSDYLAAVFRWSKGAVQLFCVTLIQERYVWPWLVMAFYVFPIVLTIVLYQVVDIKSMGGCDANTSWYMLSLCNAGPITALVLNPLYIMYCIYMIALAIVGFKLSRVGAFAIMFENITYFFNSVAAIFWCFIPCIMCFTGSTPLQYDAASLTLGGLWIEIGLWLLLLIVKDWAPLENGRRPPEHSLLRAQQMYFCTAPLHFFAIFQGFVSGFSIVLFDADASRWSSFDNTFPIIVAKVWTLGIFSTLLSSVGFGLYRILLTGFQTERVIGLVTATIILLLVSEPFFAMFFYQYMRTTSLKQNVWRRCTAAICGGKMTVTLKHAYVLTWFILLLVALHDLQGPLSAGGWKGL